MKITRNWSEEEVRERAKDIRLLLLDVDGVLTDGRIIYGNAGVEVLAFHVRDGLALKSAQACGITVGVLSGRKSEALLRRAPARSVVAQPAVYEFGRVRVDVRGTEVLREGQPVSLSAREFQLLRFLLENQEITLSREDLLTRVWGYDASTYTRTVDVHVRRLREKLENDPSNPARLLTVWGVGYKFEP